MELRRFLVIAIFGASALPLAAAPAIRHYPLDAGIVFPITLGINGPTTVVFPGPLTALEGANVATQPNESADVLLSYQPGQRFFSVRALREGAKAGLNVVYQERVYALRFSSSGAADRAVIFRGESPEPRPERLRALLDQAKFFAVRAAQWPSFAEALERTAPATTTEYHGFAVTLDEVFRWEADDVLVFHARLENRGERTVTYDAEHLGVRLGRDAWTAAAVDASGAIPPHATTHVYFAIKSSLPATAAFSVVVPTR